MQVVAVLSHTGGVDVTLIGYDLDRTIPVTVEAVHCLMPSLYSRFVLRMQLVAFLSHTGGLVVIFMVII